MKLFLPLALLVVTTSAFAPKPMKSATSSTALPASLLDKLFSGGKDKQKDVTVSGQYLSRLEKEKKTNNNDSWISDMFNNFQSTTPSTPTESYMADIEKAQQGTSMSKKQNGKSPNPSTDYLGGMPYRVRCQENTPDFCCEVGLHCHDTRC